MNIVFGDHLIPKIIGKEKKNDVIKCIMLQSTGQLGDKESTFYDNYDNQPDKRMAHYVIGKLMVAKYMYSGQSIFISDEKFTDRANALLKDKTNTTDTPAIHVIAIEIILDADYDAVEKNLVRFLGEFLFTNNMDTNSLWRRYDVVASDDDKNHMPQYPTAQDWNKLLVCVNSYIDELKKPVPNPDNVTTTGCVIPDTWPTYGPDDRAITTIKSVEASELSKEDYLIEQQGDVQIKTDRFTVQIEIVTRDLVCEPIYPDLTTPPRSSTNLYNKVIENIKIESLVKKPVIGKVVNISAPYPIDQKIAELECHYPIVHIDEEILSDLTNVTIVAAYLVNLSSRAEKRLVQLENTQATMMRYLHRLSSRVTINCVYYGGQNAFGKYDGIRCMSDDLVSDGDSMTLDQCLNCSRYEPVLGQVYDILDEEMSIGLAPILDDIQMSRSTMGEHIKLSRLEEIVDENEQADSQLDALNKRDPNDKDFNDLMPIQESFTMDWTETLFKSQKPDVNEYAYSPVDNLKNKETLLKPENKYEDGYAAVIKKQITVPNDSYNIPSSGFGGGGLASPIGSMDSYDFAKAQARFEIVKLGLHVVELAGQEMVLYQQGPKIPESEMSQEPEEIIAKRGGVLYIDCSHFMKYLYVHNGLKFGETTFDQFPSLTVIGEIKNLQKSLDVAFPGDLVFYGSGGASSIHHVALYIGKEDGVAMMVHASDPNLAKNRQINKSKVDSMSDFYAICRHPGLPVPTIKVMAGATSKPISNTLQEALTLQLKHSPQIASGNNWINANADQTLSFLDPSRHNTGNERYQFLDLSGYLGLTVEQIHDFLVKAGANSILTDNASSFIEAAKAYNVSEVYLAAHCCLETGYGAHAKFGPVYNMYGIGAIDSNAAGGAQDMGIKYGWTDPAKAISGGGQWISNNYVNNASNRQNTLYNMRWSPNNPGNHQYATDINWAVAQTSSIAKLLGNFPADVIAKLRFEVPVYKV